MPTRTAHRIPYVPPPVEPPSPVTPSAWRAVPTFCGCGERLLLIRPGRTHCERCRQGVRSDLPPWRYESRVPDEDAPPVVTLPPPSPPSPVPPAPTSLRILVTGSRDWKDRDAIRRALIEAARDVPAGSVTVVHGAARGADSIADEVANGLGMQVEDHPVTPSDWRRVGKGAGHVRNAEMVRLGADVVLAFPLGESRGTRGCMQLATEAGLTVRDLGDQPPPQPLPVPPPLPPDPEAVAYAWQMLAPWYDR